MCKVPLFGKWWQICDITKIARTKWRLPCKIVQQCELKLSVSSSPLRQTASWGIFSTWREESLGQGKRSQVFLCIFSSISLFCHTFSILVMVTGENISANLISIPCPSLPFTLLFALSIFPFRLQYSPRMQSNWRGRNHIHSIWNHLPSFKTD